MSTLPPPAEPWALPPCEAQPFAIGYAVGPQLLRYAAHLRNLEVERFGPSYFTVCDGETRVGFWQITPQTTSNVGHVVSCSKAVTKKVLAHAGVPIPDGRLFPREAADEAWRYARRLGVPVVVKPMDGRGGRGVTAGIHTAEHFDLAWELAFGASSAGRVIVERHIDGRDHRLFVVGDRMAAAICRVPAYLVGDGAHTIAELVEAKARVRLKNPAHGSKPFLLTEMMLRNLRELKLGPESVLESGRRVILQPVANISGGGEGIDVTDQVHPGFAQAAVRAVAALPNVMHAGVDILAPDISKSPDSQRWAVCETNTEPVIGLHHFPMQGTPRDVAGTIIETLFPGRRAWAPGEGRRVHLTITGRVTGVGYRKWTQQEAGRRGLVGWVRNHDRRVVHAVLCGPPNAVDDLVAHCRSGPSRARTQEVEVRAWSHEVPPRFEIRADGPGHQGG